MSRSELSGAPPTKHDEQHDTHDNYTHHRIRWCRYICGSGFQIFFSHYHRL